MDESLLDEVQFNIINVGFQGCHRSGITWWQTIQLYLVTSCERPKEVWDTLQNHFEPEMLANKLFLKKQYKEGMSMEVHLKHMKEITERLAAIGAPINEEDQVVTLLGRGTDSHDDCGERFLRLLSKLRLYKFIRIVREYLGTFHVPPKSFCQQQVMHLDYPHGPIQAIQLVDRPFFIH